MPCDSWPIIFERNSHKFWCTVWRLFIWKVRKVSLLICTKQHLYLYLYFPHWSTAALVMWNSSNSLEPCGASVMLLAKRLKGFSAYLPPSNDQKYSFTNTDQMCSQMLIRHYLKDHRYWYIKSSILDWFSFKNNENFFKWRSKNKK